MKIYRLVLSTVGVVFVEADRHAVEDGILCFYREDSIIAEYAQGLVRDVTEPTAITQRVGMFSRGGGSRSPSDDAGNAQS
jgi:hypothetical protein